MLEVRERVSEETNERHVLTQSKKNYDDVQMSERHTGHLLGQVLVGKCHFFCYLFFFVFMEFIFDSELDSLSTRR